MADLITICADTSIAVLLEEELCSDEETLVCCTSSYEDCLQLSLKQNASILILQIRSPVFHLQDLFYELQEAGCFPAILAFEVTDSRHIRYTVSNPETFPCVKRLAQQFCRALADACICEMAHFRTTPWEGDMVRFADRAGREEALKEILRGCTQEECRQHQQDYGFDFRNSGYYLFFWELQSVEYTEHRLYKDIYNLIGRTLERECREAIKMFNGGEAFYINLLQLCVIINDRAMKSEAGRSAGMEAMLQRLVHAASCKTASRYLSKRINALSELRQGYDVYVQEKGKAFFVRDQSVMREDELEARHMAPTFADVQKLLSDICKYLRYDIENPGLIEALRRLYIGFLKPAMSFPMYYYSTAVICMELIRQEDSFSQQLEDNLNPYMIQFSSIEFQYETILSLVDKLRRRSLSRPKTKRSLLLKAMNYIEENYYQEITASDIANTLYISNVYLSQIFKSELGVSVIQYLINFRIAKAKTMLAESDDLIYYVAEQVGFPDGRHFAKTFKRIVGETPSEYRKNFRKTAAEQKKSKQNE